MTAGEFLNTDGPMQSAHVDDPARAEVVSLADTLILSGRINVQKIDRLVGWATHADCPAETVQAIANLLREHA